MIKLRRLKISDAKEMINFSNDYETKLNTNFLIKSNSISHFKNFIRNSYRINKTTHLAIDLDGAYAGTISLKNINDSKGKAELAIVVLPKYRGQGVGSKALKLILIKASQINLNQVFLNVYEDNLRAISLYLKFGFIKYFTSTRENLFLMKKKKLLWLRKYIH